MRSTQSQRASRKQTTGASSTTPVEYRSRMASIPGPAPTRHLHLRPFQSPAQAQARLPAGYSPCRPLHPKASFSSRLMRARHPPRASSGLDIPPGFLRKGSSQGPRDPSWVPCRQHHVGGNLRRRGPRPPLGARLGARPRQRYSAQDPPQLQSERFRMEASLNKPPGRCWR